MSFIRGIYRFRLLTILTVVIGSTMLLAVILDTYWHHQRSVNDMINEEIYNLSTFGKVVQSHIEVELGHGDYAEIEALMKHFKDDPANEIITLLDANDQVMSTMLSVHKGQSITQISKFFQSMRKTAVIKSGKGEIFNDATHLTAYFPVQLDPHKPLSSNNQGILFWQVNIHKLIESRTSHSSLSEILFNLLIAATVGLIAWVFLKNLITDRAERIITNITAYNQGNKNINCHLDGNDELSQISRSIQQMIKQVEESTQKISQDKMKTESILSTAVDSFIVIDERGIILTFNPSAEKLFGYQADEIVGQNISMLMTKQMGASHDQQLNDYMHTRQARIIGVGREVPCVKKDGSVFPAELSVSAFEVDGTTYFTGVLRDITERLRHERELMAARDVALESMKMKSEFLANINHEFRTPMNGILGSFSLLQDTELTDEQRRYMQTAEQSAQRLLQLLDNILQVTKLDQGDMLIEHDVFNVRDLLSQITDAFQERANSKSIFLEMAVSDDLPELLVGDRAKLERVLNLLLDNAIKFTDAGSVSVTCKQANNNKPGQYIFDVTDTGIGVAPEKRQGIFDKFTQADGSSTRRYQGAGIGLALCKQMVLLMRGDIQMEENPEGGSRFWFSVPLASATNPVRSAQG